MALLCCECVTQCSPIWPECGDPVLRWLFRLLVLPPLGDKTAQMPHGILILPLPFGLDHVDLAQPICL